MPTLRVLGLMSGSSLDGIDLALCTFDWQDNTDRPVTGWRIIVGDTVPYTPDWLERLRGAADLSGKDLVQLHADYGRLLGSAARRFLDGHELEAELLGCHGYALFHEPERGYSFQLGQGSQVAAAAHLPAVTDLRTGDVIAGGQGAPLAPVADRHLFPEHTAFLNLGGIANFSLRRPDGRVVAGDVSGCCQILDRLARLEGLDYDDGGQLARGGRYLPGLADRLDALDYHARSYPKSLSNAWVTGQLWSILRDYDAPVPDRLHTFVHWLAARIATDIQTHLGAAAGATEVMVSGGGTHNAYLMQRLNHHLPCRPAAPEVVDYKEAALMALCALLRQKHYPNSLASATGARADTLNGAFHLPPLPGTSEFLNPLVP